MKFYKLEENLTEKINLEEKSEVYAIEKDNIVLGYGILNLNTKNKIEIFIKDEYRGFGYGKILFGKMLDELKKINCREVELTFLKSNYRIKNIIVYFGGLQVYTSEKEDSYLIPIN